ncbi:hypothetical protein HKX48_003386 [Thoreauomyces humboldtii]|nr:hypothetical protein HKX48_003386 [Thoreauomyces humboldtii]
MTPAQKQIQDSSSDLSVDRLAPSPFPTLAGTDRQMGLWYLLPHIWDSLWLSIPVPMRALIASLSVPWLLFCLGSSVGSASAGTTLAALMRLGQQAVGSFGILNSGSGGFGGQAGGGGVGGFLAGCVSSVAVWLGWKWVQGTGEGVPALPASRGEPIVNVSSASASEGRKEREKTR